MNYNTIHEARNSISHKKQKVHDQQTRKAIRLIFISVVVFVGILFGAIVQAWANQSESSSTLKSSEQTIIVESGDTLWAIASVHAPTGSSLPKFIYKLKKINHLESSRLEIGQQLLLPQ